LFDKGIEQFKDNMTDIFEKLKEAKIPVIIGTLTYNLKDQPPFISTKENNSKSATDVYNEALAELQKKNFSKANTLFRQAKDLDALRFRAPEKINETIKQLAKQYDYPIADIDNYFDSVSPNGIVGNNLMTDHLHPTLNGYQKIGKVFFEKINETNVLPKRSTSKFTFNQQDSIAIKSYHFTQLDSTIAKFRIQYLKNDWPFVVKEKSVRVNELIKLNSFIDTIAIKVVDNKISWEKAHRDAADIYFRRKEYSKFAEEYRTLIDQYPVIIEYYENPINQLLYTKQYDIALNLLQIYHKTKPSAFNSKWMGIILLSRNEVDSAIKYLEESLLSNSTDAQTLYNVAGAYSIKKNYTKALEYINRCIASEPDFPGARQLQYQLNSAAQVKR
jgi:tetratricopeptide (TPR) repeat protein